MNDVIKIKRIQRLTLEQFLKKHGLVLKIQERAVSSDYHCNFIATIDGLKLASDKYRPSRPWVLMSKDADRVPDLARSSIDKSFVEVKGGPRFGPVALK